MIMKTVGPKNSVAPVAKMRPPIATLLSGQGLGRCEAFLNSNSELCDHVVAEDEEIDILEKQVDQEGVSLLIRFHPVASDMREVVSSMKVSANLEHADENWLKPKVPNFADDLETRSPRGKVPNFNVQLQAAVVNGH